MITMIIMITVMITMVTIMITMVTMITSCAIAIGEAVTSLVCFFTTLRIAAAESRSSGA